jgi:hypothetical protein
MDRTAAEGWRAVSLDGNFQSHSLWHAILGHTPLSVTRGLNPYDHLPCGPLNCPSCKLRLHPPRRSAVLLTSLVRPRDRSPFPLPPTDAMNNQRKSTEGFELDVHWNDYGLPNPRRTETIYGRRTFHRSPRSGLEFDKTLWTFPERSLYYDCRMLELTKCI